METTTETPVTIKKTTPTASIKPETNLPSVRVVVAHHNENLQWLSSLPKDFFITISQAGDSPKIPKDVDAKVEKTPNGGWDCGQWIRWIDRNYNNLDDIIAFVQGSPFIGHTFEILLEINRNKMTEVFDYFCSKRPFHTSVGKGKGFGNLTWIVPPEYHVPAYSCGVWGSQHYVTKEVILRRPHDFYTRLAGISTSCDGITFQEACEHFFNIIYGVTMEEVK
jgi:hypothetical protein